jgi:hypothetical protein
VPGEAGASGSALPEVPPSQLIVSDCAMSGEEKLKATVSLHVISPPASVLLCAALSVLQGCAKLQSALASEPFEAIHVRELAQTGVPDKRAIVKIAVGSLLITVLIIAKSDPFQLKMKIDAPPVEKRTKFSDWQEKGPPRA